MFRPPPFLVKPSKPLVGVASKLQKLHPRDLKLQQEEMIGWLVRRDLLRKVGIGLKRETWWWPEPEGSPAIREGCPGLLAGIQTLIGALQMDDPP